MKASTILGKNPTPPSSIFLSFYKGWGQINIFLWPLGLIPLAALDLHNFFLWSFMYQETTLSTSIPLRKCWWTCHLPNSNKYWENYVWTSTFPGAIPKSQLSQHPTQSIISLRSTPPSEVLLSFLRSPRHDVLISHGLIFVIPSLRGWEAFSMSSPQ